MDEQASLFDKPEKKPSFKLLGGETSTGSAVSKPETKAKKKMSPIGQASLFQESKRSFKNIGEDAGKNIADTGKGHVNLFGQTATDIEKEKTNFGDLKIEDKKYKSGIPGKQENFEKILGSYHTHSNFINNPKDEHKELRNTIGKMHNWDMDDIRDHYNNTTGRHTKWSEKPLHLRPRDKESLMSFKNLSDADWTNFHMSDDMKKELDNFHSGKELLTALDNGDVTSKLRNYLMRYEADHYNPGRTRRFYDGGWVKGQKGQKSPVETFWRHPVNSNRKGNAEETGEGIKKRRLDRVPSSTLFGDYQSPTYHHIPRNVNDYKEGESIDFAGQKHSVLADYPKVVVVKGDDGVTRTLKKTDIEYLKHSMPGFGEVVHTKKFHKQLRGRDRIDDDVPTSKINHYENLYEGHPLGKEALFKLEPGLNDPELNVEKLKNLPKYRNIVALIRPHEIFGNEENYIHPGFSDHSLVQHIKAMQQNNPVDIADSVPWDTARRLKSLGFSDDEIEKVHKHINTEVPRRDKIKNSPKTKLGLIGKNATMQDKFEGGKDTEGNIIGGFSNKKIDYEKKQEKEGFNPEDELNKKISEYEQGKKGYEEIIRKHEPRLRKEFHAGKNDDYIDFLSHGEGVKNDEYSNSQSTINTHPQRDRIHPLHLPDEKGVKKAMKRLKDAKQPFNWTLISNELGLHPNHYVEGEINNVLKRMSSAGKLKLVDRGIFKIAKSLTIGLFKKFKSKLMELFTTESELQKSIQGLNIPELWDESLLLKSDIIESADLIVSLSFSTLSSAKDLLAHHSKTLLEKSILSCAVESRKNTILNEIGFEEIEKSLQINDYEEVESL